MLKNVHTPSAMVRGKCANASWMAVIFKSIMLKVKRDSNGNVQNAMPIKRTSINSVA